MAAEHERLQSAYTDTVPWRRWGPYLSERQWGTVWEDYGEDGNSWAYFPHSQSRSRAYRAGEDGILGRSAHPKVHVIEGPNSSLELVGLL